MENQLFVKNRAAAAVRCYLIINWCLSYSSVIDADMSLAVDQAGASTAWLYESIGHPLDQCSRKRVQQLKNVKSHGFLDFEKDVKHVKTYY